MLITILVVMTNSGIIVVVVDWWSWSARIDMLAWMKMSQINTAILIAIQWMPIRCFVLISYYFLCYHLF